MVERVPISTVAQLVALDQAEVVEGYRDGLNGEPCGDNRSTAYWHGWSNAQRDKGLQPPTPESTALAHELVDNIDNILNEATNN